jgi:hypothetical protein
MPPTDSDLLRITRSVPQSAFRRVTVAFPYPYVDVAVPHDLAPEDPESIEYLVVRTNAPGLVYDDQSPTRTPWRTDCLYLQSTGANLVADLLLLAPAPAKLPRVLVIPHVMTRPPTIVYLGGSRTHAVQVP